jgi:iron-sulfur cluster repair protein YtfE (RIC family)
MVWAGTNRSAAIAASDTFQEGQMSDAAEHREEANEMPEGDLVAILLRQHADITEALDRVTRATDGQLATDFEALKSFLSAHETAEQTVVRPVTQETASEEEAAARNAEEAEADKSLAELTAMGTDDPRFRSTFAKFKKDVAEHAEKEEHEEFPTIQKSRTAAQRIQLGADFLEVFAKAS